MRSIVPFCISTVGSSVAVEASLGGVEFQSPFVFLRSGHEIRHSEAKALRKVSIPFCISTVGSLPTTRYSLQTRCFNPLLYFYGRVMCLLKYLKTTLSSFNPLLYFYGRVIILLLREGGNPPSFNPLLYFYGRVMF